MHFTAVLVGTRTMMEVWRHTGTTACEKKTFQMSVQTSVSAGAQSFKTLPGMLSGPAAILSRHTEGGAHLVEQ